MSQSESTKKGGRYTVKEKEERRIRVYHLHFEENKSAVKISQLLGVSRNTINDDITYWHSQLANEFKAQNLTSKMTKQIQRIELQRDRLMDYLENSDFSEKFKIEKFISEVDNKLVQCYSKMISSGTVTLEPTVKIDEIDEDEIKKLVRDLLFQDDLEEYYSEHDLEFHFIKKTKCNMHHAENLLKRMLDDGLVLCRYNHTEWDYSRSVSGDITQIYDLEKFAYMRKYVTRDELFEIMNKRAKIERDIKNMKQAEQNLTEKYGEQSKWPEDLLEKFQSEKFEDLLLIE